MNRKMFALLFSGALLGASTAQADRPAVHGMLLFGEKNLYVSHLPMFHSPHDYQLIMKVSLSGTFAKGVEAYRTIEPAVFELPKVMTEEIKQFPAKLYDGHFERGGKLLGNVIVKVEEFIISKKLNPTATAANSYLAFGNDGEYFVAHQIEGRPNFDEILPVSSAVLTPQCEGTCPERPLQGKLSQVFLSPISRTPLGGGDQLRASSALGVSSIQVGEPIYLEEQELE